MYFFFHPASVNSFNTGKWLRRAKMDQYFKRSSFQTLVRPVGCFATSMFLSLLETRHITWCLHVGNKRAEILYLSVKILVCVQQSLNKCLVMMSWRCFTSHSSSFSSSKWLFSSFTSGGGAHLKLTWLVSVEMKIWLTPDMWLGWVKFVSA